MAKIQVRRDTSANWTSANPTLSSGEIGFETNTGKFKVGNGSSAWSALSYFVSGSGGGSSGPIALDDLTDVTLGSAVSTPALRGDQTLIFDASTGWHNALRAYRRTANQNISPMVASSSVNLDDASTWSVICGGDHSSIIQSNGSVVCGGYANSVLGADYAGVFCGNTNTAAANYAVVLSGANNTASGTGSLVGGGTNNTATGQNSVAIGGEDNVVSAPLACAFGGKQAASLLYAEHTHSAGGFLAAGDAQTRRFVLRGDLSLATGRAPEGYPLGLIELALDGQQRRLFIPENVSWNYSIKVIGRDLNNYLTAAYNIDGVLERTDMDAAILNETKTTLHNDYSPGLGVTCSIGTKPVLRLAIAQLQLVRVVNGRAIPIVTDGDYEFIERKTFVDPGLVVELYSNGHLWLVMCKSESFPAVVYAGFYFNRPQLNRAVFEDLKQYNVFDTSDATVKFYIYYGTITENLYKVFVDLATPYPNGEMASFNVFWSPDTVTNSQPFPSYSLMNSQSQELILPYLKIECEHNSNNMRWVASVEALQVVNPSVLIGYDYAYSS